jgi:YggT family protein
MFLRNTLLQLLSLFKIALFLRIIIDYVRMFARSWQPNVVVIGIFELVYTITEKPMAFVRRFIPPLRLGGVSLDLSFIVLLLAVGFVQSAVRVFIKF